MPGSGTRLAGHRLIIKPLSPLPEHRRSPTEGWSTECICGWRGRIASNQADALSAYREHIRSLTPQPFTPTPTASKMQALSIRQPWIFAILNLGKDVENRAWKQSNPNIKFRGEFLLHASQSASRDDRDDYEYLQWMCWNTQGLVTRQQRISIPKFTSLERGGIVGIAHVTGVITEHNDSHAAKSNQSGWFFGPTALILDNVAPLKFTPCKGMLGFFPVDTDELGLTSAISEARNGLKVAA